MVRRVVLQKGEPINGQRYCVVSFVGPTMRQKTEVYGIKVYCASEDRESADVFAEQIREREQVYDVYVMDTNAWVPLDVSPEEIKDQRFAQELLNEMLSKQKENHEQAEREFDRKVEERKNAVKYELTDRGQQERAGEKESAVAVYFKIKQYKDLIEQRTKELQDLEDKYTSQYPDEERRDAESMELPRSDPGPMNLQSYNTQSPIDAAGQQQP